jgi:uncharacterized coiled-coil DUF342 family protein
MPEQPTYHELKVELAVMTERIERVEEARQLQATEYARRLEDLNHAAKRLEDARVADKADFARLSSFDAFQKVIDQFVRDQRDLHEKIQVQLAQTLALSEYERRHNELIGKISNCVPKEQFDAWKETVTEARGRSSVMSMLFAAGSSVFVGLIVGLILHYTK